MRKKPQIRKEELLNAAIGLSIKLGYHRLTREEIARSANVSNSLITNYFNTMAQLKRSVMRAAISRGIVEIVAQGLALRDPQALKAPAELKNKVLSYLAK